MQNSILTSKEHTWAQKREFLRSYRKQFETETPDEELSEEIEKECEALVTVLLGEIIDKTDKSLIIDNFELEKDYLRLFSEVVGSLCNLTSQRRSKTYLKLDVLNFLAFILVISQPTVSHSKYKPKISQDHLQKVLLAAQAGERIEIPVDENFPYKKEKECLEMWESIRRNAIILLRNLCQSPDRNIRNNISKHLELLNLVMNINSNTNEEGFVIYYSNMSLRFIFSENISSPSSSNDDDNKIHPNNNNNDNNNDQIEEKSENEEWNKRLQELSKFIIDHKSFSYLLGISVTNRMVKMPDGKLLWIHLEATRLLATITMITPQSHLSKLLLCIRMFCEAVVTSSHIIIHLEMSNALVRLIRECKEEDIIIEVDRNEERVVLCTVALLIFGGKNVMANNTEGNLTISNGLVILKYLLAHDKERQLYQKNIVHILTTLSHVVPEAEAVLKELPLIEDDHVDGDDNNNVNDVNIAAAGQNIQQNEINQPGNEVQQRSTSLFARLMSYCSIL